MNYNYNNFNNKLEIDIKNEISIFDGNHCLSEDSSFTIIKENNGSNSSDCFEFTITGNDKLFKGNFENLSITLNEIINENKCNVFHLKKKINDNFEIYNDNIQKTYISKIKPHSYGTYRVDFFNLVKEEFEYFEMVSDEKLNICDIFYGDKQKEAPVVCKIRRNNNDNDRCDVFLTAKIDYIFMLGLASFFFCKDIYNNKNNILNKNYYDAIASIDMSAKLLLDNKKDKDQQKKDIDKPPVKKLRKKPLFGCILLDILCCCCLCKGNENQEDPSEPKRSGNRETPVDDILDPDCCELCLNDDGDCICCCFKCSDCNCGDCNCGDCNCGDCNCGDCNCNCDGCELCLGLCECAGGLAC